MKVVHICTTLEGGAGICARRIVEATKSLGIDTRILVAKGNKQDDVDVIKPVYPWSKIWPIQKIQVLLNMFGKWPKTSVLKQRIAKEKKQGPFTCPITDYTNLAFHPWVKDADIIHLHWVGDFLDYESFFKNVNKPIVWTIHDENPGLGGFHYISWKKAATNSLIRIDDEFIEIKRKAYADAKSMTLVAISTIMAKFFKRNELLKGFPIKIIHNGIDGDAYIPINKSIAREALSIEKDELVFLFAAYHIHEDRKGLKELIEALEKINRSNITLICLGKYNERPQTSFNIRCEGFVSNSRLQSLYYSAADYFVMPSFQESFGQTPLEAMACETPVIAFPCGIAPELINDKNGVMCDNYSVDALYLGIKKAISKSFNKEEIRKDVLARFSYDIIAKQYIDLYNEVLKTSK